MSDNLILLPLTYFGPVRYYTKFLLEGKKVIEQYESYVKQTYRNRCVILGANGPVVLIIPVKRKKGEKNRVRDIIIDYDTDWRRLHWRGILSAYASSPFFEFYRDIIEPFFISRYRFLVDYCYTILNEMLRALEIPNEVLMSEEFIFPGDPSIQYDYRELISPKKDFRMDRLFYPVPYQQVFCSKSDFIPDLSILDLLFNLGPDSKDNLRKSIKTKTPE